MYACFEKQPPSVRCIPWNALLGTWYNFPCIVLSVCFALIVLVMVREMVLVCCMVPKLAGRGYNLLLVARGKEGLNTAAKELMEASR